MSPGTGASSGTAEPLVGRGVLRQGAHRPEDLGEDLLAAHGAGQAGFGHRELVIERGVILHEVDYVHIVW